jgi:hypothetical protein
MESLGSHLRKAQRREALTLDAAPRSNNIDVLSSTHPKKLHLRSSRVPRRRISRAWTWPDAHPDPKRVRFSANRKKFWGRETETRQIPRLGTESTPQRVRCGPCGFFPPISAVGVYNGQGDQSGWRTHVWHPVQEYS